MSTERENQSTTAEFARDLDAIARIDAVQNILEVVCRTTGLGFSAVARVTESRWIACAVRDEIAFGLKPGGELQVETTICDQIRQTGELVAIDHVAIDESFCTHPTPKLYGFQSYISVPINLPDGRFCGTLCAIDPRPAKLNNPTIIGMLKLFAELIAQHLDSQERMAETEKTLLKERETSQLREQFIAVLGHDLRNPLAAIQSGAALLRHLPHDPSADNVLGIIQRSVSRMTALIDDVLDFARGRLGGGLKVRREVDPRLSAALEHVVMELSTAWPNRKIEATIAPRLSVPGDTQRISQVLSNLLGNALTHGDPDGAVQVSAAMVGNGFEISVTNAGPDLPPEILRHLFEPFGRAKRAGQQGLGLGLYICFEIARAHEGTLTATSSGGKTCFTFRI